MVNKPMREWMDAATVEEQTALAKAADTSRKYLYKLATGERTAQAELAGRLEQAAADIRRVSKKRLPLLLRSHLCPACAGCPYAARCTAGKQ